MNEEKLMVSLLMKDYFVGERNIQEVLKESFSQVDKMNEFIDEKDMFFEKICNIQVKLAILKETMLSKKIMENREDYKYIIKSFEEVTNDLKRVYEEEVNNECK